MANLIPALLAERAGYVRRGMAVRAAAVDAELERLGHDTSTLPEVPAAEQSTPPKGRRRPTIQEGTT